MKIPSKRDPDLLSTQRPIRRSKKRRRRSFGLWRIGAVVIVAGGAYGAYLKLAPQAVNFLTQTFFANQAPTAWQIVVASRDAGQNLAEKERNTITTTIAKTLQGATPGELTAAAELVLRDSPYDEVAIVKTAPTSLYVRVGKRSPSMLVVADKMRYLSTQATVYGLPGEAPGEAGGYSLLTGVFDGREAPFTWAANNSLVVTPDEKLVLDEALLLQTHLQDEHLNLHTLTYKKYRGFFASLNDPQTEIAFGRAPFLDKMKKLKKVLAHLSSKGVYAAKIELDYEGKVFIKEKSI